MKSDNLMLIVPAGGENTSGGGGNSNGRSRKAVLKMLGALYSSQIITEFGIREDIR